MKYNKGDRVRVKSIDWYNKNKNIHGDIRFDNSVFVGRQSLYCGCELTICLVTYDSYYVIENDYYWTDEMIEGLVEEEVDLIPKFGEFSDNEPLDIPTMTTEFVKEHGFPCPNGYIFKDENGNVINATKIVLEKKTGLTQEQINIMVHKSCVLFCKYCGCGIPRETCISLGTCNDHDEYRSAIRAYLMNKYKD